MAALGDEVLDGYVFPACSPCSYPYPAATKGKGAAGGNWQHRGGGCLPASSSFPGCWRLTAAEYFDTNDRDRCLAPQQSHVPDSLTYSPRLLHRLARATPLGHSQPSYLHFDSFRYQVDPSQRLEMKDNSGLMLVKLTYPVVQFLEQKYGYYHCKDCNIRWESAYVWCVQGTNKVYFKQFCRTCQKSYNPYRVEDITCQSCKQTRCSCPVKLRHVDPKRPHRQDLCGRCKGKRLSCDSTFSFKYII
ncbi:PREDICTED: zygote arrest protein 1 [Colobus angolensis palliatus]|uniref:zygote arrest protein 1 n=1 Tax=Colobus angolensis palliatus TaxID=336983 RepID=UPI0005F4F419|nr:PREDICTED: zygote arrest protein 1 [Colobus angolensis palliatus]